MVEVLSLEETPTWALSVVVLLLSLISLFIEALLHLLTKFLKQRKRKSLTRALQKIKTGLMQMGFISLLLTMGEEPISKICVTKSVGNSLLPCKSDEYGLLGQLLVDSTTQISGLNTTIPLDLDPGINPCDAKGMVQLVSREGIMQLHIFIFALAVFHVLYCVTTMCLGIVKMARWKAWEEETRTLSYQIENDPRRFRLSRQTSFGQRHLKSWSSSPYLLWPACFLRQFSGSVAKTDYFALRYGFIKAHFSESSVFDFHKFLSRAFDDDFQMVVGIRLWIWIFSILFIFFSAHGFYSYFWLPFVPLMIALIVGTKLQVIITQMCLESRNGGTVVRGALLVEPKDDLFWFRQPQFLLHLIHFILFQNSFQLAFFCWTWYEFGLRSCFHRKTEDIALRITMGVAVQLLCGYVTLPLYALVTQMGSSMKKAVFTERVATGLKHWHALAQRNLSRNRSSRTGYSSEQSFSDTTDTSLANIQELGPQGNDTLPHVAITAVATPEITAEATSSKTITKEAYDDGEGSFGEISFGTSWKEMGELKFVLNETTPDSREP